MEPLTHPNPVIIVIFGAAGDLTWRKLVPALYTLFIDRLAPGALCHYRPGPQGDER